MCRNKYNYLSHTEKARQKKHEVYEQHQRRRDYWLMIKNYADCSVATKEKEIQLCLWGKQESVAERIIYGRK